MLQGWLCGLVTWALSFAFAAFVQFLLLSFGKEESLVHKHKWVVPLVGSVMGFAFLFGCEQLYNRLVQINNDSRQAEATRAKQFEVLDKRLEGINAQVEEITRGGLSASVLSAGIVFYTANPTPGTNVMSPLIGGVSSSPLNNNLGSGVDMLFVLHVSNSGRPTTAWNWSSMVRLPDGREVPAVIPEVGFVDSSRHKVNTVVGPFTLREENSLLQHLSFQPLGTGEAEMLWMPMHINGIASLPVGTHFFIDFRDVYGRTTRVEHVWTEPQ